MCVCVSGLANYCVPAGEAYQKALDIACEITQKVRIIINLVFFKGRNFFMSSRFPSKIYIYSIYLQQKKVMHSYKK
jgi:hypothetical protein